MESKPIRIYDIYIDLFRKVIVIYCNCFFYQNAWISYTNYSSAPTFAIVSRRREYWADCQYVLSWLPIQCRREIDSNTWYVPCIMPVVMHRVRIYVLYVWATSFEIITMYTSLWRYVDDIDMTTRWHDYPLTTLGRANRSNIPVCTKVMIRTGLLWVYATTTGLDLCSPDLLGEFINISAIIS